MVCNFASLNTSWPTQLAMNSMPMKNIQTDMNNNCKLSDLVQFLDGELCPVHLALLHKIESWTYTRQGETSQPIQVQTITISHSRLGSSLYAKVLLSSSSCWSTVCGIIFMGMSHFINMFQKQFGRPSQCFWQHNACRRTTICPCACFIQNHKSNNNC